MEPHQIVRNKPLKGGLIDVYFWSRNPLVLAAMATVILAWGLTFAWVFESKPEVRESSDFALAQKILQEPTPDIPKLFAVIEALATQKDHRTLGKPADRLAPLIR